MSRILVTGGAGFIGSHLCDALLGRGDEVTVFDDLSTGRREHIPTRARLVVGDIGSSAAVRSCIEDGRFDAVLHAAGQASIAHSFSAPERDLRTNVTGTLNVLEACVAAGVPRLVHASSMTVYGEPESVPTSEESPCRPVSYYGVTKYAAERYVHVTGTRADTELAVTSLRMFNVYGERQSVSNPYQGVLAIFLGNVLRGEPITILSDGQQTRDFVYVGDVVTAWLGVLDEPRAHGGVFNVGSGAEVAIAELAETVLRACGEDPKRWEIRRGPPQPGDQRRSAARIDALCEATGWRPSIELQEGMRHTIEWAQDQTRARAAASSRTAPHSCSTFTTPR